MAVISYNEEEVKLLARLMRAEAEGDGNLGMLMVGNTGVNRVMADCLDFQPIRTITDMVSNRRGDLKRCKRDIFISPRGRTKKDWPGG